MKPFNLFPFSVVKRRSSKGEKAFLLFLLAILIRIPLTHSGIDLLSDACEYLNVARHIAQGEGPLLSIKWNFYSTEPVVHSSLGDRPIGYPLALGLLLRFAGSEHPQLWGRVLNLFLSSLSLYLLYFLITQHFGPSVAFWTSGILLLNPSFLTHSVEPFTEPLFLVCVLLGLLLLENPSPIQFFLSGLFFGYAFLTRPTGLPLAGLVLLWLLLQKRPFISYWCFGLLSLCLPFWFLVAKEYHNPFYSTLKCNYAVLNIQEATWEGYGRSFGSPLTFIKNHLSQVMEKVYQQTRRLWLALSWSLGWFLPFILFLRREDLRGSRGLFFSLALLNFTLYALSWVVRGANRYILLTSFLLTPFLVEKVEQIFSNTPLRSQKALLLLFLSLLPTYIPALHHLYLRKWWSHPSRSSLTRFHKAANWLLYHSQPRDIIASDNPWLLNLLTERPGIICPYFNSLQQVTSFIREYQVRYILLLSPQHNPRIPFLKQAKQLHLMPGSGKDFLVWKILGREKQVPHRREEPPSPKNEGQPPLQKPSEKGYF